MISNKIDNKITGFSKNLQQSHSETGTSEHDKEIPKERYTSPEKRREIIDKLRLNKYNNRISKNHKSFKKFKAK